MFITEKSRTIFVNDFTPMKTGETRRFQIDKSKHPHCELIASSKNPNLVELNIEKTENLPDMPKTMRRFMAKNLLGRYYGKADFQPGYFQWIDVEPSAQGCGVGAILTQLGMGDTKLHKLNEQNVAVDSLNEPNFKDIKKWALSSCRKLIVSEVNVRPRDRAGMFFNSAKASGYELMFIKRETDDGNPTLYPPSGACSVETLQERYDGNGNMVDEEGNRLRVRGEDMQWFFCFPKKKLRNVNHVVSNVVSCNPLS